MFRDALQQALGLMIPVLVTAVLAMALAPQSSNRLWWADLELDGPATTLTLSAGRDGTTTVTTELFAGEELRHAIPVPLLTPLGLSGLTPATLPALEPASNPAPDLAWSQAQPAQELSRRYRPFLNRSRPHPPRVRTHAGPAEFTLLLAVGLIGLALRHRTPWLVAASGVAAIGLLGLGMRRSSAAPELALLEVDAARGLAAEIRLARGELGLASPQVWLETMPEDAALELRYDPRSDELVARAQATLWALRGAEVPELGATNGWRDLERVWSRSPEGAWSDHGPWRRGTRLGEARAILGPSSADATAASPGPAPGRIPPASNEREGSLDSVLIGAPPGWLASGLPPGRGVLLGRLGDGEGTFWVRITGWDP